MLKRRLGRGGMGDVWLAWDNWLNELVALKFLPPDIRDNPVALDYLRMETTRSHKLTHMHIVRIHDLHVEEGGGAFIAMEYVDGPTLEGLRLQQPKRVLGWDFLRPLMQQLCLALEYAHDENVIHRDLKPANMMVDGKGRLRLTDFGVAAVVSDSMSRVSQGHSTSGTLLYMSPQQLAGKRPQVTDDVYSLGATLYESLASKPPFHTGDVTHQILHEPPEPLEERLAGLEIENEIPPRVASLIMACLAKEPAQRPQSAHEVAARVGLNTVKAPPTPAWNLPVAPVPVPSKGETPNAEPERAEPAVVPRHGNLLWVGGIIAALMLLAGGGWLLKMYPAKPAASFSQTLIFHGPGTNDEVALNRGEVTLVLANKVFRGLITKNCEARFKSLPLSFSNQTGLVTVSSKFWRVPRDAASVRLTGETLRLPLEHAFLQLGGAVRSAGDDKPIAKASVSLAGVTTNTDVAGEFSLYLPRDQVPSKTSLLVSAAGYVPYRQTVPLPAQRLIIRLDKLTPPVTNFTQSLLFHGPQGTNDRVALVGARVTLKLDAQLFEAPVINGCEAAFEFQTMKLLGQTGSVTINAEDWRLAKEARAVRLTGEPLRLGLERAGLTVLGGIRSFEEDRPIAQAQVRIGGVTTNADATGKFNIYVTGQKLSQPLELEVAAAGYLRYRESFTPPAGRLDIRLHKEPRQETNFVETLVFFGPRGTNDPIELGGAEITLEVGGQSFRASVTNGYEAHFYSLASKWREQTGLVKLTVKGWRLPQGGGSVRLTGKPAWLALEPALVTVRGSVDSAGGDQPVALATVSLAGLATNTDPAGGFSLRIPEVSTSPPLSLEVTANGYEPYHTNLPALPELITIRLQKAIENADSVSALLKQAAGEIAAGNPERAEALYRRAVANHPASVEALHDYGMFLHERNRREEARTNLFGAIYLARKTGDKRRLAPVLNDQGLVLAGCRLYPAAEESYAEALKIYRDLHAGDPAGYRTAFAQCLVNRGMMRLLSEKFTGARDDFQEALTARDQDAHSKDADLQAEYAATLVKLATALGLTGNAGDRAKARKVLDDAIGKYREVVQQKPIPYGDALAAALRRSGGLLRELGERKSAQNAYTEAVGIYNRLQADAPDSPYRGEFANVLNDFAVFLVQPYNTSAAQVASEYYTRAINLYRSLADEDPELYRFSLAQSWNNLGTLCQDMDQVARARAAFEQALTNFQRLPPQQRERQALFEADTLLNLSRSLEKLGDREAAQRCYKEAIPAYYKLFDRERTPPHIEGLASANSCYAKFLEGSNSKDDYAGAQNAYVRAIQLYGSLAGSKSWTSRSDYALAHNNYGVLLVNRQKLPEAREHYEEALKICSTCGYHELRVEVLNNLAALLETTSSFAEAENRYNDAIKLCEQHLEEQPDAFGLKKAKALVGCAHVKLAQASKGSSKSNLKDAASYLDKARTAISRLPPSEAANQVAQSERALHQLLDGVNR